MAPATFEMIAANKCIVAEGGEFYFTADKAPENVTANGVEVEVISVGDKLFAVKLSKDDNNVLLEWK